MENSHKESLWGRVMWKKYVQHQEFFHTKPKQGDSSVWKSILKCKELIRQGMVWCVGDDRDILFWLDNWIDNCSLIDMMHLQVDSLHQPFMKVAEFITPQKQWNLPKLNQVIQVQNIIQRIRGIDIPLSNVEDTLCWGLDKSGEFTTKSATWLAHNSHPLQEPDWDHKWIWEIDTMPKIQIFLWQIMH